jgi:flavin-dependent dehydrogenase
MTACRTVEIVGGGLAGLALGIRLRHAGIPVIIYEAGRYPRHRVCGEFIVGLRHDTWHKLMLPPLLASARPARKIAWFHSSQHISRLDMPRPAQAISRYSLDASLASTFQLAGGILHTNTRIDPSERTEGRIFANGRSRTPSPWLGLKCHLRGLAMSADLEMHLGCGAYVGLARLGDDLINVCGLFRRRRGVNIHRDQVLLSYLRATSLDSLAERVEASQPLEGSSSAVAGVSFCESPRNDLCIRLGDTFSAIAPFTGNGMAIAFESAAESALPIIAWSYKRADWPTTVDAIQRRLRRRFTNRLNTAKWIHPLLYSRAGQQCFRLAQRVGLTSLNAWHRLLQ